jgi:hypothetical protein
MIKLTYKRDIKTGRYRDKVPEWLRNQVETLFDGFSDENDAPVFVALEPKHVAYPALRRAKVNTEVIRRGTGGTFEEVDRCEAGGHGYYLAYYNWGGDDEASWIFTDEALESGSNLERGLERWARGRIGSARKRSGRALPGSSR